MRTIAGIFFGIVTMILIYFLDNPMGKLPALGRLLDPVGGCWTSAESGNKDYGFDYKLPAVQNETTAWMDERLVPHIHASNDHDLYYVQGYIHAYFRLWQMDMQTRAAAGRISEVAGDKALNFDRKQRRKGMVYAAENSLKEMESDSKTKVMIDAYTEGVNAFIKSLSYRDYPLEYKLMGFAPEQWTNLKISLLLKYMADDLTGYTEDIPQTYLRDLLSPEQYKLLYPEKTQGSTPVIPTGTSFDKPSLATPQIPHDSAIFPKFNAVNSIVGNAPKNTKTLKDEAEGIGSNNWAVGGNRTKSGAAILCNDPHLGLNLPSLWFEVQLQSPGLNVYGVSLPGAPGVVIGFNDSVAWGFTNNYRDVKDFYSIKRVAENTNKYVFSGKELEFEKHVEHIGIKGKPDFIDTVYYTIHGPVIYDDNFKEPGGYKNPLAVCWMAHRASNELKAFYLLNRVTSYNTFVDAIMNFQCPAQNIVFADRKGDVALWGQGQFVNKWKDQGRFIMEGIDSTTLWKELIPMRENPHVYNPTQGYVSSANQCVTDSTYPYWYNGYFVEFRAWRINQVLSGLDKATVEDMFALQNDTYSWLAAHTLPILHKSLSGENALNGGKYVDELKKWDYKLSAESIAASVYQVWWYEFYQALWGAQLKNIPDGLLPSNERTMQLLESGTFGIEGNKLNMLINNSFKQATDSIHKLESTVGLQWYKVKSTSIKHLAKIPAFSYENVKNGGWGNVVNAVKDDHGPSWRMVVEMGKEINAFGIYPGGQSGNPGSKFYADFLPNWVDGKYYPLLFLPNSDKQTSNSLKYTIIIHP